MSECNNKPYIIQVIKGGSGGTGTQGPPGPPGPGVDLPLDSTDVEYRGQDLQDVLDELTYKPLVINSFGISPNKFELGTTVTALSFNWSLSKSGTSQSIVGPQINTTPSVGARNYSNSSLSLSSNSSYVLSVTDSKGTVTRTASIEFLNRVRWGTAPSGTINSAFINGLSGNELSNNKNRDITVNALSGQYAWVAYPTRLGDSRFFAFGFEEAFTKTVVSYTNSQGYVENYNVYQSENPGQGQFVLTVI